MIYRLDKFTENSINPITSVSYNDSWVAFILTDSKEYNMFVGSTNGCAYTVKFSRYANKDWRLALCDFIEYNEKNNKNIILVLKADELVIARNAYTGHTYNETVLRETEPKILVHSTTFESYKAIQKDGMLKSFNKLNLQGEPIGNKLGDPEDFSDYIMFCDGGVTSEIIVNSKQKGKIVMDINDKYIPGARLYFDAEKIAADGLLIRDGCHLKVNKDNYDDAEELTTISELKAYDTDELKDVLNKNGMNVLECRSIGSLTHLYLMHLYRQNTAEDVHKKINEISTDKDFLEICDYYDKHVMPNGMGSFRRAGIFAIAEKI